MHKIDYTILSVDDNENNLFTLEALLSKIKGVKVINATSGDEAINELKELSKIQFHPEVVEVAVKVLKDIKIEQASQFPKTKLERERFAYYFKDQLTGAFTIEYLKLFLRYQFAEVEKFYVYIIKLHNFSAYNQKYGWQNGDLFLKECVNILNKLDENISVFRIEGDDFLVLSKTEIKNITDMLDRKIKNEIIDFEVIKKFITDKKEYLQKIIDAKNTEDFI
jgi:GGDEF domain-containing protein